MSRQDLAGHELAKKADSGLRPAVSTRLLLLLVVGDILGAGIYILVGEVAAEVGGAAWVAFLAAFIVAGLSASSYSELVTRYPGAAGSALYAEKAYTGNSNSRSQGRLGPGGLSFVVGMAVMLSSLATAATTARAFAGNYLGAFVDAPVVPVAIGLLFVLTALSIRGIEVSAKVNVVMTVVEVGGLILVLVVGIAALSSGEGSAARATDFTSLGPETFLAATALAFFAFLGFEDAVHLSEEVSDPRKTFPRVLFGAVAIASVLYVTVVLVATMVVEPGRLAGSDGPLLEVVSVGPLAVGDKWFAVVALVAVTNTSLFALVASSRLLFGMAKSGAVPAVFARVHPRWRTPVPASIAVALLAVPLASTGAVNDLAGAAVTLLLGVLVVVNLAAFTTRLRPEAVDAFLAPRWVAPTGVVASAGLLSFQLLQSSGADWLRLAVLAGVVAGLWILKQWR